METEVKGPGIVEEAIELTEGSVVIPYRVYGDTSSLADKEELEEKDFQYPEGERKAYLALLSSFLGLCASFGLCNSLGAIESYVSSNILQHNSNQIAVSMIFSLFSFNVMFCSLFSGILFDLYGGRIICGIGSALYVGGLFATGNCTKLYQFILAFGVCSGVGCAMLMSPLVNCIGHFFNRKRGMAMALCMPGASLGGVIWPQVLRKLYVEVGFQWAMRILGFCTGGLLIISCLCYNDRHEEMKLEAKEGLSTWNKIISFIDLSCLKDKTFVWLTGALFMNEFSLIMTATYIPSYALSKGFSDSVALTALTVYNASGILGRILPSYFADKFGHFTMITNMSGMMTLSVFILWLPLGQYLSAFFIFTIVYGFGVAGTLALTPMCTAAISEPKDFGRRYGTAYFIVSCSNLISLPVGRTLTVGRGGYTSMVGFSGATCLLGTVMFIVTSMQYKRHYQSKSS